MMQATTKMGSASRTIYFEDDREVRPYECGHDGPLVLDRVAGRRVTWCPGCTRLWETREATCELDYKP